MSKILLQSEKTTKQLFHELNSLVNRYDLPSDLETLLLELIDRYRDKTIIDTDDIKVMVEETPLGFMPNMDEWDIETKNAKPVFVDYLRGYANGAKTVCEGVLQFADAMDDMS